MLCASMSSETVNGRHDDVQSLCAVYGGALLRLARKLSCSLVPSFHYCKLGEVA